MAENATFITSGGSRRFSPRVLVSILLLAGLPAGLIGYKAHGGLKRINDLYGHAEGDRALKRAARALEMTFRDSDVIARLGGDEFAVLAIEASRNSEKIVRAAAAIVAANARARRISVENSLASGLRG